MSLKRQSQQELRECVDCHCVSKCGLLFGEWLCEACGTRHVARETQALLLKNLLVAVGFENGELLYEPGACEESGDKSLTKRARAAAMRDHTLRLIRGVITEIPLYGATEVWAKRPWRLS